MRTRILLGITLLAGCSDGDVAAPASSAPSATVASAAATSAAAAAPKAPGAYLEISHFGPKANVFDAGKRMVVCEDGCAVPLDPAVPMPKVFTLDAAGSREDPALSIEGAHGVPRAKLAENKPHHLEVHYFAKGDKLFAHYVYDHQGEGGYEKYDPTLRQEGLKWVPAAFEQPEGPRPHVRGPELDPPFAHVPWPSFETRARPDDTFKAVYTVVYGGGGPLLAFHDAELATWEGKAWKREAAPWKTYDAAARLANGSTVVIADALAWLWPAKGRPSDLALGGDAKGRTLEVHAIDGAAWIVGRTEKETTVWSPVDASQFAAVVEDKRDPPRLDPHQDANPMPEATNLTLSCKTPFAVIASTKTTGLPDYALTRAGLKGHGELQDELTFVEFSREGTLYFGAQANTEEALHKLVDILEKNVKGMKPVLGCLAARGHVDGGANPAQAAYRVVLNLETGEFIARR